MPIDLFEKYNITPPVKEGIDLFEKYDINLPQQKEQSYENPFQERNLAEEMPGLGHAAEYLGKPLAGLVAHGLQGALNTPTSYANLIPGVNIPHFNIGKYVHPGRESTLPEDVVESLGGMWGMGGPIKAAAKLGPKLGGSKFAQYLTNVLGGGIGGYAGGEVAGQEGEYLAPGRLFGGFLGAGVPAVGGALKFMASLKPSEITNKVLTGKTKGESESNKLFNKFLKPEEKFKGLVETPDMSLSKKKQILEDMPRSYIKTYNKWLDNPNIKNTHKLYKASNQEAANLRFEQGKRALTSAESNKLKSAQDTLRFVEKGMLNAFEKGNRPDLAKAFYEANKHYTENVLGYKNPAIASYLKNRRLFNASKGKGLIKPAEEEMVSALQKNPTFQASLGNEFPEMRYRQQFGKYLAPAAITAGGLGGGSYLAHQLFGGK